MSLILEDLRREYTRGGLSRENLLDDPYQQLNLWLEQAVAAQLCDPTAMSVATVDPDGQPSQRIVLLKHLDHEGLVFYTNYGSNKAKDISNNNKVSLHFPWIALDRQVIVKGTAIRVSTADSMKYFLSRPRESQLAAWASAQSSRISGRSLLESQFMKMKEKFAKGDIPLPDFWGGYRVVPHSFEFWQGRENRLHDRFLYTSMQEHGWLVERLAP